MGVNVKNKKSRIELIDIAKAITIFLLHKNLLQGLILPWVQTFIHGNAAAIIIAAILTLVVSMALCIPIKYYIPQLLGQFPRYGD